MVTCCFVVLINGVGWCLYFVLVLCFAWCFVGGVGLL